MTQYYAQISGWLLASGNSLLDFLPSGTPLYRVVPVEPESYWTGYVSTSGGSFKLQGDSGNFYGTCCGVADAERPAKRPIYECSVLGQDTPLWNMNKLPDVFLTAIHEDRDLV